VAQQLRSLGFDAAALKGGFDAWRAAYPVEPSAVAA
jgi:rhodanese-related sulfurtransferase